MSLIRCRSLGLVFAALLALPAAHARASESLRKDLAGIAAAIKQVLDEEKQQAVAMGEIPGPPQVANTSAGPGLQQVLVAELHALGIKVEQSAPYTVSGKYFKVGEDRNPEQVFLKLKVQVANNSGE